MAAKIDGLVIEIGANTSSFKQSMRDVQNEAKGISKDLKTVSESLKLDPENVGKAADKLKLLKDQAENATKKVEVIKKAIEALNKEYDDKSSKEYTDQLHKLEAQLESATREQELANQKVKQFSENAGDAGKSAFSLGDAIKGHLISEAIKKGLSSLVDLAKSLASHLINAGKQLADFSWDAVKMAGEWNDATSTSIRAFGDFSDEAVKYAEDSAMVFGIYSGDLLQSMNNLGLTFSAMSGITREESLKMSEDVMSMAADIRAAFGGDFNDIQNNLQKALTGTYKGLQQYGVFLTNAEVKAYALEKGIVKTTVSQTELQAATIAVKEAVKNQADALAKHGENSLEYEKATNRVAKAEENLAKVTKGRSEEMTKAQMAEATLLLLQEKFGDVTGQAVAEADAFPALLNRISTAGQELKKRIGVELLPVVEEFMQKIMGWLQSDEGQKALDSIVEKIREIAGKAKEFVESGQLEEWVQKFKENLPGILEDLKDLAKIVGDLVQPILDVYRAIQGYNDLKAMDEAIKSSKKEVHAFADSVDVDMNTLRIAIKGFAELNNISLTEIYGDWGTYQPQIAEYMAATGTISEEMKDKVNTATGNMASQTKTDLDATASAFQDGLTRAGNADTSGLRAKTEEVESLGSRIKTALANFIDNSGWFQNAPGAEYSRKASGGPVSAGHIYQVNDDAARRKELFIPYTNGYILNGNDTERVINNNTNNSRSYGDLVVNVNSYGTDAASIADEIGQAVNRRLRMSGAW